MENGSMRTLSVALIGTIAAGGVILALPRPAVAQEYNGRYYSSQPYYGGEYEYVQARSRRYYSNDYVPARRRYLSEREYSNQRYGTYRDVYGGRPATLGYCQRNPGRCR